jgi:hypothetical protein
VLDPALKLNSTVRDAVLCVCELGWLYGRVAGYLKGVLAAGGDSLGVVVQAFGFALQVLQSCNILSVYCIFISRRLRRSFDITMWEKFISLPKLWLFHPLFPFFPPMQEELHDYYRLLAVLEQELQITAKTGILSAAYQDERRLVQRPEDLQSHRRHRSNAETGKVEATGSSAVEGDAGAPGLTLLRLRAWLQEPIER